MLGQSLSELEKRRTEANTEIQKTTNILNEVSKGKKLSINRINIINRQIRNLKGLMNNLNEEITDITVKIDDNQYVIESMESDIVRIKSDYAQLIQEAYKQKSPYFELTYVFASKDINQAYKRIKYLKQYAEYRKKQVYLIDRLQDLLEKKTNELLFHRQEKNDLLDQYDIAKSDLSVAINKQQNQVARLQKRERDIKKELAKHRRQAKKLDNEIKSLIAKEMKPKTGPNKLTPEQNIVSENFEKNRGKLPWPTQSGIVTESFGVHAHPVLKNVQVRSDGISITTLKGTKARAVFDGEVMKIFAIPGANQTVIVRHGNYLSVYKNLVDVKVETGEYISIKQELGTIYTNANEGNDTTLNFMIWKEMEKLDPENWLSK
ncbi:MAG: peptidoglycan DD-metalloendopeptidase family protein [Bacteroidales bacterium]|nr:peptidoglycan DD-metalloendopeptidase family protein [Bacteroidales bacterium]